MSKSRNIESRRRCFCSRLHTVGSRWYSGNSMRANSLWSSPMVRAVAFRSTILLDWRLNEVFKNIAVGLDVGKIAVHQLALQSKPVLEGIGDLGVSVFYSLLLIPFVQVREVRWLSPQDFGNQLRSDIFDL